MLFVGDLFWTLQGVQAGHAPPPSDFPESAFMVEHVVAFYALHQLASLSQEG